MNGYWARGIEVFSDDCVDPRARCVSELGDARDCAQDDGWPEDTEQIGWAIVVDHVVETARGPGPCSRCGALVGEECADPGAECDRATAHDEYAEFALRQVGGLAERLATLLQSRPDLAVAVVGRLRVLSPWTRSASDLWVRRRLDQLGLVEGMVGFRLEGPAGPGWTWAVGEHSGHPGPRTDLETAQAAADAELRKLGWALAGVADAQ